MEELERFIIQHETIIVVLIKILIAVLGVILGVSLFTRFIYNFTIKYFENQGKDIARIKKFIWGPDGEPKKGIADRLTDLERAHKDRTTICPAENIRGKYNDS